MSQSNAPFGLRAVKKADGGECNATSYKPGARAAAAAIYYGDLVKIVEDGTDFLVVAAAGDQCIGQFAGCQYRDSTGKPITLKSWPGAVTGATDIEFFVYDDPDTIFAVQADTTQATNYTSAVIGDQCDIIAGAGSAATGMSGFTAGALKGAGVQGQLRIVGRDLDPFTNGFYDATDNPFPVMRVMIAKHQFRANIVAI